MTAEEAEQLYLRGMRILADDGASESEIYLNLSHGLATCYEFWGRYGDAERWYRQSLEAHRRAFGDTDEGKLVEIQQTKSEDRPKAIVERIRTRTFDGAANGSPCTWSTWRVRGPDAYDPRISLYAL